MSKINSEVNDQKTAENWSIDKLLSDLEENLEKEFDQYCQENLPFKKTFDSEKEYREIIELRKSREFSFNDLRSLVKNHRDLVAKQSDAWAKCREFCQRLINVNYSIGEYKLLYWVKKFADNYGFTEKHMNSAKTIIKNYVYEHANILKLRSRYKDDDKLISYLIGKNFLPRLLKDVKVEISAGSFNLFTNSITANKIANADQILSERANFIGIACLSSRGEKYNIFNKDVLSIELLIAHEQEHQVFEFFNFLLVNENVNITAIDDLIKTYDNSNVGQAEKYFLLKDFFEHLLIIMLKLVKNEFFAMSNNYYKGNLSSFYDRFFKKGGLYDYSLDVRTSENKTSDNLYQELSEEILVRRYRSIIKRAFLAFFKLAKALESNIQTAISFLQDEELELKLVGNTQKAIAMLTTIPMQDWPAFVRHQLLAMGLHSSQINNDVLQGSIIENRVQRFLLDSRSTKK